MKKKLKLRTILFVMGTSIIALPLTSLFILPIYENELIKQTEIELISQSATISGLYLDEVAEYYGRIPTIPVAREYRSHSNQFYLRRAISDYQTYELKAHHKRSSPRPKAKESDQIISEGERLIGKKVSNVFSIAQQTTLSGLRLLNPQGIVIGGREDIGKSFAFLPEIEIALKGQYTSLVREDNRKRSRFNLSDLLGNSYRVFTAFPIIQNNRLYGVVYMLRTPRSILQHIYDEIGVVAILAGIVLFSVLFFSLITAFFIARPINRLVKQTRMIGTGESSQPIRSPRTQELELLTNSFSNMAEKLDEKSDYIKQFATQVSHEFKTPLTSIQGAVELLQDHSDMSAEQRQRFLDNITDDCTRLKSLVTRLFEIARYENIEVDTQARCDLSETIEKLRKKYRLQQLTINSPEQPFFLAIAEHDLTTVLTNLFDNAKQHGASEVTIFTNNKHQTQEIAICDNGQGISALNHNKIFERFFTTRRQHGGTGLGLGIVRSILRSYHADITLSENTDYPGATFILTFTNE